MSKEEIPKFILISVFFASILLLFPNINIKNLPLLIFSIFIFYFLIKRYMEDVWEEKNFFVYFGVLFFWILLSFIFKSLNLSEFSYTYPWLVGILFFVFDWRISFITSLYLATIIGFMNSNFYFIFIVLISILIFPKMKRNFGGIIKSLGILFASSFTLAILKEKLYHQDVINVFIILRDVFISSFISVLGIFISIPYMEKWFKIITKFKLFELSNLSEGLLKELKNKAPGTFQHSYMVANLAAAAAEAIGADSLLTRVGAYYHDIGKMLNPIYFIENLPANISNPHEKLSPLKSVQYIKEHVTEGVKLARKHYIPEKIIRFISTHHGKQLIKQFYKKALEMGLKVKEKDFRYPGPLPESKEEGICMLADCVEAAVRASPEKTKEKIKKTVEEIIEEKQKNGDLQMVNFSYTEIIKIKKAFMDVLLGTYHSRLEYKK